MRYSNSLVFSLCLSFLSSEVYALSSLQRPANQLSDAEKLIRQGKYAEAEAALRALIAGQPSPDAFDLLGYCNEQQNKLDGAESAYRRALQLNADRNSSKARLGIVYAKRGKNRESIAILETIPANLHNNPEALFYLCRAYLETGNKSKALETTGIIEGWVEKDPGALLSVSRLLVSKELYEQAVTLLRKTVQWMPASSEANYSLAYALVKMRKYDEASLYLDKAHNLDPTAPKVLLLQALVFLDEGKFANAKDFIRKAQALKPDDKFAAYLWGRVLVEEGAYKDAIKLLNDLIASGFEDPNAHLTLITAYRKNGEFQKALNHALKTAQAFPDNPAANLRAGLELEFLGEYDQAEKFLRNAVTLSPGDPEILTVAKFTLATISAKNGKEDDAVRLLEDVILGNPKDVQARMELADIYHKRGQYEAAVKILQEALSLDSQNKRAHFLLGNVLTKLGKSAEAQQHLKIFEELEKAEGGSKSERPTIYTQSVK